MLFLISTFTGFKPVAASEDLQTDVEGSSPKAVCMPGIFPGDTPDCLLNGPAAYLTELATIGLTLPLPPLAYTAIDPALANVNVRYAEVRNANAPVFGSIEDALQYKKKSAIQTLNGQTVYISYTDEQEIGGKKLYMTGPNTWMTGNDLSRIGALPPSQGLIFEHTPVTPFGWILTYFSPTVQIETKRTPGLEQEDYTGRLLSLYDVVQIFHEVQVGSEVWALIGPDEWVQQKYIAKVTPNSEPPEGVENERWIEINLYEQTLAVYDKRQLVFATIIATGTEPFWTQPGLFQVYNKLDYSPMTGTFEADRSDAYYLEDVPWAMYFDEARALHGAYWRAKMGYPQSHGCVNLAVGDARWVYEWAQDSDWVYVWDPSGETPTDPSVYGSGGF
jgi:lipoprotein-anchoring transpeptidase ErfK/SrfK